MFCTVSYVCGRFCVFGGCSLIPPCWGPDPGSLLGKCSIIELHPRLKQFFFFFAENLYLKNFLSQNFSSHNKHSRIIQWAPSTSALDLPLHFLAYVTSASDFTFCLLVNCLRGKGRFHWDFMNRHCVFSQHNAQDYRYPTWLADIQPSQDLH